MQHTLEDTLRHIAAQLEALAAKIERVEAAVESHDRRLAMHDQTVIEHKEQVEEIVISHRDYIRQFLSAFESWREREMQQWDIVASLARRDLHYLQPHIARSILGEHGAASDVAAGDVDVLPSALCHNCTLAHAAAGGRGRKP